MRSFIAAFKMLLFFVWSIIIVPPQILIMVFHKGQHAYHLPYIWHKGVCLIFRLKVKVEGQPERKRQTMYVSNHLSYLDIPVIGTVLKASFVAKKDVAKWPVFGFLSKMQQTAFIDRSRSAIAKEANALDNMVARGKSLIIFPEGTSTDGRSVLPFKSSLFSLALQDGKNLMMQPFTIKMDLVDGSPPETQALKDLYSWLRDMDTELHTHLWLFAKSKGAVISLHFHDTLETLDFQDRKTLAKVCENKVSQELNVKSALAA